MVFIEIPIINHRIPVYLLMVACDWKLVESFRPKGISSLLRFAASTLCYRRYWQVFFGGFKPHSSQLMAISMMVRLNWVRVWQSSNTITLSDLAGSGCGNYQTPLLCPISPNTCYIDGWSFQLRLSLATV